MHGQRREDKQQKWHMWSEPLLSSPPALATAHYDSTQLNSFSKAGRKISVGDCALFQAENAPPFIGIIRKLRTDKEGNLKLCVNWLYRPSELKLGKGASVEAAPNEIFYSFHKDEISAAYLLHPCKVAFLRKGIDLPPGLPSFICRRVYDTANKCLYWLTEQDYTDEHQAEVDQLLDKTKHEMQTSTHSQGISQKASNTPTSSKADVALSNQGRGKKRDRNDQNVDSGKRDKLVKVEETDSRRENIMMRFEDFAAFADKDKEKGLSNTSLVEQLVQVMIQERSEGHKKMADVVSRRVLLARIIAATEREDCLTHLVQLGALSVLDDWLQEAHKGKLGDGSPKESDKGLEDLLLTLLRALDKLPVDLDALKTCLVGKSVNNLKSYKNTEIQKKARKLVDTWKKRVESEMNSSDEGKSGLNTTTTWSSKAANETQNIKGRLAKTNATMKLSLNGCGSTLDTKSNPSPHLTPKDNAVKPHASVTNEVLAPIKEEKSCSSSQSHTNSQSWCSGSGKGFGSLKEEVKTPVSSLANRSSATSLRTGHSHSSKSHTTLSPRLQRETSGRHKASTTDKGSSTVVDKGMADGGVRAETTNSQRLIVRIPNPARSPAHSVNGGSFVDTTGVANNRLSSPGSIDKHDSVNVSSKAPVHSPDTSGDAKCGGSSNYTNKRSSKADCKEEIDRSEIDTLDEGHCRSFGVEKKPRDQTSGKGSSDAHVVTIKSSDVETIKSVPAISKLNTDIPNTSNLSPERHATDTMEGGIGLLASVATSEGPAHEKVSVGRERHSHLEIESTMQVMVSTDPACDNLEQNDGMKSKEEDTMNGSLESNATSEKVSTPQEGVELVVDPQGMLNSSELGNEKLIKYVADIKNSISLTGKEVCDQSIMMESCVHNIHPEVLTREAGSEENIPVLSTDMVNVKSLMEVPQTTTTISDSERSLGRKMLTAIDGEKSLSQTTTTAFDNRRSSKQNTVTAFGSGRSLTVTSTTTFDSERSMGENPEDAQTSSLKGARPISPILDTFTAEALACTNAGMINPSEQSEEDPLEISRQVVKEVKQEVKGANNSKLHDDISTSPCIDETEFEGQTRPSKDEDEDEDDDEPACEEMKSSLIVHASTDVNVEDKGIERPVSDDASDADASAVDVGGLQQKREADMDKIPTAVSEKEVEECFSHCSDKENMRSDLENALDCDCGSDNKEISNIDVSTLPVETIDAELPHVEEAAIDGKVASLSSGNKKLGSKDVDRPVFDLNEGFDTEEATLDNNEQPSSSPIGMSSDPHISNLSIQTNSIAALVATVSATKGSFVPPSDLVRMKGDLGWKGSAATSAFRPAEPRRTGETWQLALDPNATNIMTADSCQSAKQGSRFLDIDLNIVDERGMEESSNNVPSTSLRPELDLNQVDESEESMASFPNTVSECNGGAPRVILDFDLNDGPGLDQEEATLYHQQHKDVDNAKMPASGVGIVGLIQNQADASRYYYPASSVPSTMMLPSFSTHRPDPVYSIQSSRPIFTTAQSLGPHNSVGIYPASATSGISYTTTIPPTFSYGGFPFGAGFPPSASYNVTSTYNNVTSAYNNGTSTYNNGTSTYNNGSSTTIAAPHVVTSSMMLPFPTGGPAQVSHYVRPYLISSMGGEAQGGDLGVASWVRPNLDLNAGPDVRTRDAVCNIQFPYPQPGSSSSSSSTSSLSSGGGVLKRKDPDGGFDQYNRPGFKQMTWQ